MPPRCLLIEDDPMFVEILTRVAISAGAEAIHAATARAAIDLLRQRDYDVILLDLQLAAGSDGGQVLDFLRRTKPHLMAKVLCVTGTPGMMQKLKVDVPCVDKGNVVAMEKRIRALL